MKIYGEEGQVLEERTFNREGGGEWEWVEQEIPEKQEIIGVFCNTSRMHELSHLGLMVWTPSPTSI